MDYNSYELNKVGGNFQPFEKSAELNRIDKEVDLNNLSSTSIILFLGRNLYEDFKGLSGRNCK